MGVGVGDGLHYREEGVLAWATPPLCTLRAQMGQAKWPPCEQGGGGKPLLYGQSHSSLYGLRLVPPSDLDSDLAPSGGRWPASDPVVVAPGGCDGSEGLKCKDGGRWAHGQAEGGAHVVYI